MLYLEFNSQYVHRYVKDIGGDEVIYSWIFLCGIQFLYARHLTDVLWYGAVRLYVRPYVASSTILVDRI